MNIRKALEAIPFVLFVCLVMGIDGLMLIMYNKAQGPVNLSIVISQIVYPTVLIQAAVMIWKRELAGRMSQITLIIIAISGVVLSYDVPEFRSFIIPISVLSFLLSLAMPWVMRQPVDEP